MNRETLHRLNVIPEGKAAWLNYEEYQTLKAIFEGISLPDNDTRITDPTYFQLYDFLTNVAKLPVPPTEIALHFNAFTLIRRGYNVEEITAAEYEHLSALLAEVAPAEIDDLELHEVGGHRALYHYLTRIMGLSVKPGRGPVWHRATDLVTHYERSHL